MVESNDGVHKRQELGRAQRPAVFEEGVVDVLHAQAGDFAEDIEFVEHVLEIDQTNVPGTILLTGDRFEGRGCSAMAASRIKENEIYGCSFCHEVVYRSL